jgi:glutathione reductase (NADPH)
VDLFVIGGGSGGVRAARIAAGYGARVVVAEEFRYGGTCVIRGCVPKKLLAIASRFADAFEEARGFGWSIGEPTFDWTRLRTAKDAEITRLEGIYRNNLIAAGVETVDSRAVLEGPNRVRLLATGAAVDADRILVATGGTPFRKRIEGAELAITSNEIFDLEALPERLMIEGGGFIAAEFGCLLQRLGVQVTLVYRGEQIMRGFDDDLRDDLAQAMRDAGIEVVCGTEVEAIRRSGGGLAVSLSDGSVRDVGQILVATGRVPSTAGMGLEAAGVELGRRGAIVVGPDSRTSAGSVWAVGDVTDRMALTPVAIREGHAFADTVFGNKPWNVDHENVPAAVFSTPEIGTVGITEAVARERFGRIRVYRTRFRPMSNVFAEAPSRMMMKLVVDDATDRVVGVHVLGPDAGEMIQLAGIAVKMGATKAQFDATVAVHPTAAEELVTLRTPVA